MNVLAAVFARGGSQGVPKKNLQAVGGRSLVARAVDAAHASGVADRIVCSTDDPAIAQEALQAGAEVPFLRPAHLASSEAPERMAWRHLIESIGGDDDDILVSVPPTAPLRSAEDIRSCLGALQADRTAGAAVTITDSPLNPHFNLVYPVEGEVRLVLPGGAARRQDAPTVYALTSVAYAARFHHVRRFGSLFDDRVVGVHVPPERAVDIDTVLDLEFARFLNARQVVQ